MTLEEFMNGVHQNIARINEYKSGMDGRGGQCDCIGLIIGAIRLMGEKWSWTHGSNYSARNRMRTLYPLTSTNQLGIGYLVYKACEPGASNYNLPAKYNSHYDQKDYYHVGVITNIDPLEITHCTGVSGGIKRDTKIGKWNYYGELDLVVYDYIADGSNSTESEAHNMNEKWQVFDGTLKMRTGPSVTYSVIEYIPDGTVLTVLDRTSKDWYKVQYDGRTGYVMAQYLRMQSEQDGIQQNHADDFIQIDRNIAMQFFNELKQFFE